MLLRNRKKDDVVSAGHALVWIVVSADTAWIKQCCIHTWCNTYNTNSLSGNKQPPPTQSAIHDTMKEFCGMFGWCLFTNYYMQVFNTSLPPLGHSVSLLGCQTPTKSKDVLKVICGAALQWHSYTRTHAVLRPAELSGCPSKTVA